MISLSWEDVRVDCLELLASSMTILSFNSTFSYESLLFSIMMSSASLNVVSRAFILSRSKAEGSLICFKDDLIGLSFWSFVIVGTRDFHLLLYVVTGLIVLNFCFKDSWVLYASNFNLFEWRVVSDYNKETPFDFQALLGLVIFHFFLVRFKDF